MHIKRYVLSLLVLIVVSSGCNNDTTTNYPVDLTPLVSVVQTPSISATQTLTLEPLLSSPPADIEKRLEDLLQTNGNCNFPCFWDIYPEETSYAQVENFLNELGKKGFVSNDGDHTFVSTTLSFREDGRVYLKLDIQNSVVRNIEVTLDGLWHQEIKHQDWSAYNLDEVLSRYGAPASIELFLNPLYDRIAYGITLNYKELNTSIFYEGNKNDEKDRLPSEVSVCPGNEISSVKINLGKNPIDPEPSGVPLSKASNLDVDSFYKLFTEDPSACFPINLHAMGW